MNAAAAITNRHSRRHMFRQSRYHNLLTSNISYCPSCRSDDPHTVRRWLISSYWRSNATSKFACSPKWVSNADIGHFTFHSPANWLLLSLWINCVVRALFGDQISNWKMDFKLNSVQTGIFNHENVSKRKLSIWGTISYFNSSVELLSRFGWMIQDLWCRRFVEQQWNSLRFVWKSWISRETLRAYAYMSHTKNSS